MKDESAGGRASFILQPSSFYNGAVSITGALRYALKSLIGKTTMLKPGDPAPDFNTTDHEGKALKLRDLRGKKVVLWFFPKADTGG